MHPGDRSIEQGGKAQFRQHYDLAHADLGKAIVLSRRTGDEARLATSLMRQARIECDRGHPGSAIPLYEQAVKLHRRANDPLALASALQHLGDAYRERGAFDDAQPCYDEALAIYRAVDETPSLVLADALKPLALLQEALGFDDAAEAVWREAFELYDENGAHASADECGLHLQALATPRPVSSQ